MQGTAGLGRDASNLHILGLQVQQWKLLDKGEPWSWGLWQHQHLLQVDTVVREDWSYSQVSKSICKVIFHFVFYHLSHES